MIRRDAPSALALTLALSVPVLASAQAQQFRPLPAGKTVAPPVNPLPAAGMGFSGTAGLGFSNTPMNGFPGGVGGKFGPSFATPTNPFMTNPMTGQGGFSTAPPNATLPNQFPTGGLPNNLPGSQPNVSGAPWANGGAAFGYTGLGNPYNPYANTAGYGNPYAGYQNNPYANPYLNGVNSYNDPRLNPYLYNPFLQNPLLTNPLLGNPWLNNAATQPPSFGQ